MADTQTQRRAEVSVRRVMQRVRLATQDTIDDLQAEMKDILCEHMNDLGAAYDRLVAEIDKANIVAQKRIYNLALQREKDKETLRKPKELLQMLSGIVDSMEVKIAAWDDDCQQFAETKEPDLALRALEVELDAFSQRCGEWTQLNLSEMTKSKSIAEIENEWRAQTSRIVGLQKEGRAKITKAKGVVSSALSAAKAEILEQAKAEAEERLQEIQHALARADEAVVKAENEAAELIELNKEAPIEEILAQADLVESLVNAARVECDEIRATVSLPTLGGVLSEIQAFISGRTKNDVATLAQFMSRLTKIASVVSQTRSGLQQLRNSRLVAELKPLVMESVKSTDLLALVDSTEPMIKAVEACIEFRSDKNLDIAEMTELAEKAAAELEEAASALQALRLQLQPWDETLDEGVKKELRASVAGLTKAAEQRTDAKERRVGRVHTILSQVRLDIEKKRSILLEGARALAIPLLRRRQEERSLTVEEIFADLEVDQSGAISKSAFIAYFVEASQMDDNQPSEELLGSLFNSLCTEVEIGLDIDVFLRFALPRMKVARETGFSSEMSIEKGRLIGHLKIGDVLEVLEGPLVEESCKLTRVRLRTPKGAIGWASVASNKGTTFLVDAL